SSIYYGGEMARTDQRSSHRARVVHRRAGRQYRVMLSHLAHRIPNAAVALAAASLIVLWPAPVHASRAFCLMTDEETGRCELEATWKQRDGGPVVITITSGGGGTLQECQRPHRSVSDAKQGDAVVPCFGGDSRGWYSAKYDCYF